MSQSELTKGITRFIKSLDKLVQDIKKDAKNINDAIAELQMVQQKYRQEKEQKDNNMGEEYGEDNKAKG